MGRQFSHPATTTDKRKGVIPLVLLAFPLFLSVDLENVSAILDNIINVWKIMSLAICAFLYVDRILARKPAAAHIIPMLLVMLALLFSTIVNAGSLDRYLIVWGGFFAVCLLVEANINERPLQMMLALRIVLVSLAVFNFATVLAQPSGLWSSDTEGFWLLGHRNNFGTPLIAALVVSAAYDLLSRRRLAISTYVIGGIAFASVALTWSASSVVASVLAIVAVLLVALIPRGLRALSPFLLLVTYVAVDIGIVFFQIQQRWSDFIATVLDRSADLTGRTRIWEIVFQMIRESPILGKGVQLSENNGLTNYDSNFVHAHNGELDILMQGGLLTFIPFVIMILLTARNSARFYQSRAVQILFIGLILVMFRGITGLFFSSYAVLLVFLLLNSGTIARVAVDNEPALDSQADRPRQAW